MTKILFKKIIYKLKNIRYNGLALVVIYTKININHQALNILYLILNINLL